MPITWMNGNLFDSGADILVDFNNAVGVSGAGLALQFKKRFPLVYEEYRLNALNKLYRAGKAYLCTEGINPMVINMITKDHWRDASRLTWIDTGLQDIRKILDRFNSAAENNNNPKRVSIALGKPGCGRGGLYWGEVRPLVIKWLGDLPNIVFVYGEPPNECL